MSARSVEVDGSKAWTPRTKEGGEDIESLDDADRANSCGL